MFKKDLTNMSVIELQTYLKQYIEKKGNIPLELKQEIEFQIEKEKINNKIFAEKLINSKWFNLGVEQTIRKKQAIRILIQNQPVLSLDTNDIIINLVDLTLEAISKINFNFIERLSKL